MLLCDNAWRIVQCSPIIVVGRKRTEFNKTWSVYWFLANLIMHVKPDYFKSDDRVSTWHP